MVLESMSILSKNSIIIAYVKKGNERSYKVFKKVGFVYIEDIRIYDKIYLFMRKVLI